MAEKRKGLGKGLGALIPSNGGKDRPVDVFFPSGATVAVPQEKTSVRSDDGAHTTTTAGGHSGSNVSRETSSSASAVSAGDDALRDDNVSRETTAESVSRETSELMAVPGAQFAELPVDRIVPNPKQPRTVFDEDELAELVHSIGEVGVLQPVVVRTSPDSDGVYELIMGERRLRAAKDAGLDRIPSIIRETAQSDMLRDALLENLHRSELNPLEEAAAYRQLMDDFACTQEELSAKIGRSRPQISNTLRLLRLPPLVQRRVAAGVLSPGHARALLGLDDGAAIEVLAQRIVAEGLSVRATEEEVLLASGGADKPKRNRARAGGRNPELDDLAGRLGDRLDTRVQINLGAKKGKLSVDFASVDDLNRILTALKLDDVYRG
nr:ParB/RepB/Spo0J family partition protein [Spelaeicoccus albus]